MSIGQRNSEGGQKITPWFLICVSLFFCVFISRTLEKLDDDFCDIVQPILQKIGAYIHLTFFEYLGITLKHRNATTGQALNSKRFTVQDSWHMLVLSSAAYSNDPYKKCLKHAPMDKAGKKFGRGDFKVSNRVSAPCDLAGTLCFAFTGYSHSMRYIYVVFRGTERPNQLLNELALTVLSSRIKMNKGKVQRYFKRAFDIMWPCIRRSLQLLRLKYPRYHLFVTGHSLGGALSNIAATTIVEEGIQRSSSLTHITFGEPRVGDLDYADYHDKLVPNSWRVVHYKDIVTHMPPCVDMLKVKMRDSFTGLECEAEGANHQHGIEVFYPNEEMNTNSTFRLCQGFPRNEDNSCSNKAVGYDGCKDGAECVKYHCSYYGIPIGSWPSVNCSMTGDKLRSFLLKHPPKPDTTYPQMAYNSLRFGLWLMGFVEGAAQCHMTT